jgi:hypothetical protein
MRSPVNCFQPELVAAMGAAYDVASQWLDANMSTPPHHHAVARHIVLLAEHGVENDVTLCGAAIQWFYFPVIVMTDTRAEAPRGRARNERAPPPAMPAAGPSQGRNAPNGRDRNRSIS